MTKNANGYTTVMKGMLGELPFDAGMFKSAFRQQASVADKMSRVVLAAAEKSTEISAAWTKSALGEIGNVTCRISPTYQPNVIQSSRSVSSNVAGQFHSK